MNRGIYYHNPNVRTQADKMRLPHQINHDDLGNADSLATTRHIQSIGRRDPGVRELMARGHTRFVSKNDEF